jgi:lysophospholipase L1-like esterase
VPSVSQEVWIWDTDDNLNGRSAEIPSQPERYFWPSNAAGLRMSREVGTKAVGERRVLLLGDSYADALNVHPGERFADLVDQRLSSRPASDGGRWNLINGGIQNGAPSQYVLQLRRWLPEFEPDIVVVALAANDLNDDTGFEHNFGFVFDANGLPLSPLATVRLTLQQRLYTARYLERALGLLGHGAYEFAFPPATDVEVVDWKRLLCAAEPEVQQLWRSKTGHYLLGLRDMTEAAGARFVVLMIHYNFIFDDEPWHRSVFPGLEEELRRMGCRDTKGSTYRRLVAGFLEENRIPFRDSYDGLLRAKREAPKRKLWGFYDYHFSPAGHRVIAEELSALLDPLLAADVATRAGAPPR